MYTKIQNVSIIVALLKKHNIRHLVLSAGTRHVPLAHSVENDDFFTCYSVVDERSAAYFALGISKELRVPVAVACTSSTATCNYLPAVSEAYYQNIPLLVLTGDRDPYLLDQLEDQMINQVDMYKNFIRKCVTLPVVTTPREAVYCQRLVNEAMMELRRGKGGPVQINFPINQTIDEIADASAPELPEVKTIRQVYMDSPESTWQEMQKKLSEYKRILVVVGSQLPATAEEKAAVERFFGKYNCAFATEYLSNLDAKGCVNTYLLGEALTGEVLRTTVSPDLVIFYGNNYVSRWKALLKTQKQTFVSWFISRDGDIKDPFMNLEYAFDCTPEYFFSRMADMGKGKNNENLYDTLVRLSGGIKVPTMPALIETTNKYTVNDAKFKKLPPPGPEELVPENYLSGFAAMHELTRHVPENSLLHLSILNSTRITQMFPLKKGVTVYSNIGTDGIDGSMSTFLGQAISTEKPCFLVIGDLSFFYDMNSVGIRSIGKNVHILLVNNGGGAEFYFSMGPKKLPNIDMHISAAHQKSAKAWVEYNGFKYYTASNLEEYARLMPEFVQAEGPVIMEIFTNKLYDVTVLKSFRRSIQLTTAASSIAKKVESIPLVKQALETEAGKNFKEKLKDNFKKIF